MSMHLPRRRFWRITIYLVCIILVLLAADVLWARARRTIHPGYDTTRITSPVLDDGRIDYLAAVEAYFSRGVTIENNAAPLLFEAFGREALPKTQPPDGITSRLGMPHLPEKGNYLVSWQDFVKASGGPDSAPIWDLREPGTWPPAADPLTARWLQVNDKPLQLLDQAARKPRLFIPFNGGNRPELLVAVLLPHVHALRDASLALLVRARDRLTAGQLDGCRDDLLTLHRLARLFSQQPTLVERLFAYQLDVDASRADQQASASGKFSAQQDRKWVAELNSLSPLQPPADALDISERYMMLDTTEACAKLPPSESGRLLHEITGKKQGPPAWLFPFLPVAYEQWMIAGNHHYDALLAAIRKPTYAMRRAALAELGRGLDRESEHNHLGVLSPSWPEAVFRIQITRAMALWETARAEAGLSEVTAALAAYNADHGDYPATLAELVPDYLKEPPLDNFTDRPFIYSRAHATYRLYSVGPNMIDDGGASTGTDDDVVAVTK